MAIPNFEDLEFTEKKYAASDVNIPKIAFKDLPQNKTLLIKNIKFVNTRHGPAYVIHAFDGDEFLGETFVPKGVYNQLRDIIGDADPTPMAFYFGIKGKVPNGEFSYWNVGILPVM